MRVIAFVSEDAGVGKSLLGCHVAGEAARVSGRPAVLIEVGSAGALSLWRSRRTAPTPRVIRVEPAELGATLERLHGEGVGIAVVDTPSPPSALHGEVLSWADLAVLPVTPRRESLESVGRIVRFVEGQGAPFIFIVNRAGAAHRFTAAYAMALAQHGTVCPIAMAKRPEFAEAFAAGLVVGEAPQANADDGPTPGDKADAAMMISDLWRFLDTMLTRLCGADTPPRSADPSEQRKFHRWSLDWSVVVTRGSERFPCRLSDLSGAGAGLEMDSVLAVGDAITLALPSLGEFDAIVVRVGERRTGVRLALDAERQWRLAETLAARMQGPTASPGTEAVTPEPTVSPADDAPSPSPVSPASERATRLAALLARLSTAPRPVPGTVAPPAPSRPRRGRIIVTGNEKGGCGKSTLAVHLAIALIKEGLAVATIDLDSRQATLARYLENRRTFAAAKGVPLAMPATHAKPDECDSDLDFSDLLADLARRHDFVIIDTPGRDGRLPRLAHVRADVIVTPINDSFLDLDLVARLDPETSTLIEAGPYGQIVHAVRTARAAADDGSPDWIVVRNRLTTVLARNKADMAKAIERLAAVMGFRVGAGLTERVIYRELFPFGLTLLDLRDDGVGMPMTLSHVAARQELRALMQVVLRAEPEVLAVAS